MRGSTLGTPVCCTRFNAAALKLSLQMDNGANLYLVGIKLFVSLLGLLFNSGILAAHFYDRKLLTINSLLNLNMVLANVLLSGMDAYYMMFLLLSPEPILQGQACQVYAVGLQIGNVVCVETLSVIAKYHYWLIVKRKEEFSTRTAGLTCFTVWIMAILVALSPYFNGSKYILRASRTWCGVNSISNNPGDRFVTWINCIGILLVGSLIMIMYFFTWRYQRRVAVDLKGLPEPVVTVMETSQCRLLKRAVLIATSFIFIWSGIGLEFFIEAITGKYIQSTVFMVFEVSVHLNMIIHPIILYQMDKRVRVALQELVTFPLVRLFGLKF